MTRKKKIRDAQGNVIGYGDAESFEETDDERFVYLFLSLSIN